MWEANGILYNADLTGLTGLRVQVLIDSEFAAGKRRAVFGEERNERIHTHPYFELFFTGEDGLTLVTEEERLTFGRGIVVLPPGLNHYAAFGRDAYRFYAEIDPADRSGLYARLTESGGPVALPSDPEVDVWLGMLAGRFCRTDGYACAQAEHLLSLVVLAIAEKSGARLPAAKSESRRLPEYLFRISEFVADSLDEDVTLSRVAKEMYLSEKQVSRIIKKGYGTTLGGLITAKKLSAAALLLKNTELSVTAIADRLRFRNESYFYALFRRRYGVSPLAYRRACALPDGNSENADKIVDKERGK